MKNHLALFAIMLALAGGVAAVMTLAPRPAVADTCSGAQC